MLVVWWFLAAASSPGYFDFVDGLLTSWIGTLVLFVSLAALWYHFFNGIRHLVWDTGAGFETSTRSSASGIAVLVAAAVMTVVTLVIAHLREARHAVPHRPAARPGPRHLRRRASATGGASG